MDSDIRVAILGAGYWGINLVRNFTQVPGCRVGMVCEPDKGRWAKIQALCPDARLVSNHEAALQSDEIDAIVIATPVPSHFRIALESLSAGKHTFVEKPLAQTSRQCLELIGLAQSKQMTLMAGHTFEYNPAVLKAKQLLDAGELGRVYYLTSQRLNLGIVRHDVNALWSLAPHDVSIIRFLLDRDPVAVSARGNAYLQDSIEDVAFMDLEFADGVAAHVHVSWLDPSKVRRMTIVGDKKMLVYDDVNAEARIQLYDKGITRANLNVSLGEWSSFGEFQFIQRAGGLEIPKLEFAEPLSVECAHFIESIRLGKPPRTDGGNGLRVVRVLEAATLSMKQRGRRVTLDECEPAVLA